MNILLQRVADEWYTCLYMILSHAVLFFYLPGIAVLNPLNRVAATGGATLAVLLVFSYALIFPHEYRWMVDLSIFDDVPNPTFIKKFFWYVLWMVLTLTYLYMWCVDFHHVPRIWYAIWYLHALLTITLVYGVVVRSTQDC